MKNTTPALHGNATKSALHITGTLATIASISVLGHPLAHATTEENRGILPDTTIIANRIKTELTKVGSAVTVLDVNTLEQEGIRTLDDALKFVPGVISESLGGQRGSSSSVKSWLLPVPREKKLRPSCASWSTTRVSSRKS